MRRTRWTPPRYGACPRSPSNLHWSTTPSATPCKARCSPPCWLLAAGVLDNSAARLVLRAVDGYTVNISLADAQTCRMIVATHIDNQTMAHGGFGPAVGCIRRRRSSHLPAKNPQGALCPMPVGPVSHRRTKSLRVLMIFCPRKEQGRR